MDSMIYNKLLRTPISTGTPIQPRKTDGKAEKKDGCFQELLEQKLKEESQVSFSKHAMARVMERGVDVSSGSLAVSYTHLELYRRCHEPCRPEYRAGYLRRIEYEEPAAGGGCAQTDVCI